MDWEQRNGAGDLRGTAGGVGRGRTGTWQTGGGRGKGKTIPEVEQEDNSEDQNNLVGGNHGKISLKTNGECGISLEEEQEADDLAGE